MPFANPPRPGPNKGAGHRKEIEGIYAHPIPLVFSDPVGKRLESVLGLLGLSTIKVLNPHCEGYFDAPTRSVWITDSKHSMILWRRGFFGKGDLSRSEPSWLARQINARRTGAKGMALEDITAKRRAERRQFKLDRARAIATAAAEAERAFAEGRVLAPGESTTVIPSAATWKPPPGTDRAPEEDEAQQGGVEGEGEGDEESVEDLEHLQLTLQEAFFLMWNFDCLTLLDPDTQRQMTVQEIWLAFQAAHIPPRSTMQHSETSLHFDSPFLINYVVYHHFRALGWVVKGGIKFCVDYLLYKRGPVFHHAEFAVVICPVYEDPKDREISVFNLHNVSPFSWSWLSTINRVNSQVQKTLVLVYVTIPARSRVSADVLRSPACLMQYSVHEVVLRRFIPARMRE